MHHSGAEDNIPVSGTSNSETGQGAEIIPLVAFQPLDDGPIEQAGSDHEARVASSSGPSVGDSGGSLKRLNWWLRLVIIVSLLVLTESAIFLSWLWFEDPSTDLWRRVVFGSLLTQAITITSVLIRTAIGSLAVISTSMIASVALECHGVPLDAVAEVSIARFTNGGPQSLFMLLLSGNTFKAPIRFLTTTLLLAVLASQFTSTLLVTDLQITPIGSFNQTINNSFNFPQSTYPVFEILDISVQNSWERKPDRSETFAEYSETGMLVEGVDDTGPTIRALIPITLQSEREALRTFEGMSRVIDVRISCVRPEPIIDLRFCHNDDGSEEGYFICGTLTTIVSNLPVYSNDKTRSGNGSMTGNFVCSLSGGAGALNGWTLCGIVGNLTSNGTTDPTRVTATDNSGNNSAVSVGSWLIFNESIFDGSEAFDSSFQYQPLSFLNATGSGPWLRQWSRFSIKDYNFTIDYHLDMAWCFAPASHANVDPFDQGYVNTPLSLHQLPVLTSYLDVRTGTRLHNLNIKASSLYNRTEPTYTWNAESNSYNTSEIRNQLGAIGLKERPGNPQRGILTISPQDMEQSIAEARMKAPGPPFQDSGEEYGWMDTIFQYRHSLALCPTCHQNPTFQVVNGVLTSLFADTITNTDSPALALQCLLTAVIRTIYYDHKPFFSSTDEATVTRFVYVQTPQSTRGYTTVMAIIAINVLLFLVLYFWHHGTRFSFIGNVWQSIAQVSESRETQQILCNAPFLEDKDLKESAERDQAPEGVIRKTCYYSKKARGAVFDFFKGWKSFERRSDKTVRFVVHNGIVKRANAEHESSISSR